MRRSRIFPCWWFAPLETTLARVRQMTINRNYVYAPNGYPESVVQRPRLGDNCVNSAGDFAASKVCKLQGKSEIDFPVVFPAVENSCITRYFRSGSDEVHSTRDFSMFHHVQK